MEPLYDAEEFEAALAEMVAEEAPRLFAVVQEYGEREDARIHSWGMSFHDHADLISVGGSVRLGMRSPEHALRWASAGPLITAQLVWLDKIVT
jgi:hypothetical protein